MLRVLVPAAVAVQLLGAGHLGRDVLDRRAALVAAVFAGNPDREAVVHRRAEARAQHARVGALAPEFDALAALDREAVALVDAQRAAQGGGLRGVVDAVQPVQASALRAHGGFGGDEIDFGGHLAGAHLQCQAAAVQAQRDALVVDAHQLKLGGL